MQASTSANKIVHDLPPAVQLPWQQAPLNPWRFTQHHRQNERDERGQQDENVEERFLSAGKRDAAVG
eukprot:CAMPEP_0172800506 /NCGR_PEP_ID=MMETSP1075-20121228/2641_1 /TAXON_ID=2916 /ORGANISM="Ceratium fusus, Strain PA161109" /LENGTH=66 /DNA_ID=CAMNT_0013638433 /DNA_START=68 /DNA_END=268 /DNA_ORIENTATION=-